jgi:hypothetical protein
MRVPRVLALFLAPQINKSSSLIDAILVTPVSAKASKINIG